MLGKRVDRFDGSLFNPGEYGHTSNGDWYGCTPDDHHVNLRGHDVVEHPDGTITVSPSIGVRYPGARDFVWHGYLERGVWRAC